MTRHHRAERSRGSLRQRWPHGLECSGARVTTTIFAMLSMGGCVIEDEGRRVDTLRIVDTVIRTVRVTDTVYRHDTLHALDQIGLPDRTAARAAPAPPVTPVTPPRAAAPPAGGHVAALRARKLVVPVDGVDAGRLIDTFAETRGGGSRLHGALDIPAPRGTPVLAADAGRVLKLHTSTGGGLTLYVLDPSQRYIHFYAHLHGYRAGIAEGMQVSKGEVLGYVGTTGNAPPNVPHLHYAIAVTTDPTRWWDGVPIDPLPVFRGTP